MTVLASRLLAVLVLVLTGCHFTPSAGADPAEYGLDEVFPLGGGREAVIRGEDLHLRFTEVREDSRCPTQVQCFWTGQARIAVLVERTGHPPTTTEFNTNPAPGQNVQTAEVGRYTIELRSLDPYPNTPTDTIPIGDYQATLAVHATG